MRYDVGNLFQERIIKAIESEALLLLSLEKKKGGINYPEDGIGNHVSASTCETLNLQLFFPKLGKQVVRKVVFLSRFTILLQLIEKADWLLWDFPLYRLWYLPL